MVSIDFQALLASVNMRVGTPGEGKAVTSALERMAFDSRVAWRYEQAERRMRYGRLATGVVEGLSARVEALESSLSRFSWPVEDALSRARLITPSNASDELAGRLVAEVRGQDEASRFYKYFSRGRDPYADTGLDGTSYTFRVTQGGQSRTVTVDVPDGADWGEILDLLAAEINNLPLSVQAQVIRQNAPRNQLDILNRTGAVLAVTVNAAHADQDVEFADTNGHLIAALDLTQTDAPVGPASLSTYDVRVNSRAMPTSIRSTVFDPQAVAGVTAGEHRLRYTVGGASGTISVGIEDGMTWDEVLTAVANSINSTTTGLRATLRDGERSSGLDSAPLLAEGRYLEVELASPKLGQRLFLEDYGGPWLGDVTRFFDPTGGLPAAPMGGERYVATATANGWVQDRIYEYDGAAWNETTPAAYNALYDEETGIDAFYDGTGWSSAPSGDLLDLLGMTSTATPGADASVTVDGVEMSSETGIFSLDRGRVLVQAQSGTGEESLPLSLVEAFTEVQDRFTDVVNAYNDLRSAVLPVQDLFEDGFAERWRAPFTARRNGLGGLGVSEFTAERLLWVDGDAFWEGIVRDPAAARELLAGSDGFVPALLSASVRARTPSLYDRLLTPSALVDPGPSVEREFDLHKRASLSEVIDSLATTSERDANPYLEATGLLTGVAETRRKALAAKVRDALGGGILNVKS
ncbi:hypothetical protein GGQ74_001804 [Desulfobaculum xiamenense]|uniref:Flagellar cap protein n=1 Tax=Desulfobaculum xiamenense TaxID=995050 RepID=A0A846QIZ3_9BACT|nr:hypothetical protein [Desulfobaculum xiamenense]NJB68131.1 hypothetical protein [Desulfobaculum xiamenense]